MYYPGSLLICVNYIVAKPIKMEMSLFCIDAMNIVFLEGTDLLENYITIKSIFVCL